MASEAELVLSGRDEQLLRTLKRVERAQDRLEQQSRDIGRTTVQSQKQSQDALGATIGHYVQMLSSIGGITAAARAAVQVYETWLANIKEISAESRKAQNELVTYAALQAGGDKAAAVRDAAALGAQYGVPRAEAFATAQSMESMFGKQVGRSVAEEIYRGSLVGVPTSLGAEAAITARTLGVDPAWFIRMGYSAGEASGRDPATLIRGSAGLIAFNDPQFGMSAATVLSEAVTPERLRTAVEQAGRGLSSQGLGRTEFFKALEGGRLTPGMWNLPMPLSQEQRLQVIAAMGWDTPEELAQIGITEIEQQRALSALGRNYSAVDAVRPRIIANASNVDLLMQKRTGVEDELPVSALDRMIQRAQVEYENELAGIRSGAGEASAIRANAIMLEQRARAIALTQMGRRHGWVQQYVEDGLVTDVDDVDRIIGNLIRGRLPGNPEDLEYWRRTYAAMQEITGGVAGSADELIRVLTSSDPVRDVTPQLGPTGRESSDRIAGFLKEIAENTRWMRRAIPPVETIGPVGPRVPVG